MSQEERVTFLNRSPSRPGRPVVYWMQASARARSNHALEYAIHLANHRKQPLEVVFCLHPGYPGANARHYTFLLEGLNDLHRTLGERNVPFSVRIGDIEEFVTALPATASTIVVDRGYLRHQRRWRAILADQGECPVVQVESNTVVPVEVVSDKDEYSAATIRRKIHRHWTRFLVLPERVDLNASLSVQSLVDSAPLSPFPELAPETLNSIVAGTTSLTSLFSVDESVPRSDHYRGGETEARKRLSHFIESRLDGYADRRNIPDKGWVSDLSPYLHFGHISPVEIAVAALETVERDQPAIRQSDADTLLEELIVRRELAINFTEYNDRYDRYESLPGWALKTLQEHSGDPRPYEYTLEELETAQTDDPYWNACQREMTISGKMHGYMRMYWGKKILEWTADPAEAYRRALYLNDRYELDGRDPNGYAGVAWVFGKHDRPWVERPIFGKVRYMNANGLRRKFKGIDRYVDRWTTQQ